MRKARAYTVVAVWISVMLSMSACSFLELLAPPPAESPPPPFPPPPPQPSPPQSLAPPTPAEAHAEIVKWFSTAGYKEFQVAALADHAKIESGFNACATGPAGLSFLYQWGGTRLRQLHEFARTSGCPQLHTQLAFADKELRNDPKFSCFWGATTEASALAALRRGFGRGSC
jgi:hypothetical protein